MAEILKFKPPLVPRGAAGRPDADRARGSADVVILPVVRIERHRETVAESAKRVERPAGRSR